MPKIIQQLKGSEFFRSVFTLISATSVAQLIAILIYPILTKIYTPSEHGTFALFLSTITITGIICTFKYEAAIMIPGKNSEAMNLSALSISISFIFSVLLLMLIFFFRNQFASWLGDPGISRWLYYVPLSTFLIGLFQTFSFLSNRKKQYSRIALSNASQSLVNSAVKVSAGKLFSPGAGLIIGAIIGQAVGAIIFLWGFVKKEWANVKEIRFSEMKKMAGEYKLFPHYNMIHNLTNNFSGNLPVFVISYYYSTAEVGLYSLGFLMVFRPMSLITGSFIQVFSQKIISLYNLGGKIKDQIRFMATKLFQFGLPFFLIAGIFGPLIFKIVFGPAWITSAKYMQVLLPWLFVVFISSPLSFLPDLLKQQKKAMWLDFLKLVARISVLGIGVYFNNLYLALILFSGVSMGLTGYNLFWYFHLADSADIMNIKARTSAGEISFVSEEKYEF